MKQRDRKQGLKREMKPRTEPSSEFPSGPQEEAGLLLTVHDVARLLRVPVSWVYARTRDHSVDRIPGYRLGKYWRFSEAEVRAWLEQHKS
jgi:excisionase family DNA binding protein